MSFGFNNPTKVVYTPAGLESSGQGMWRMKEFLVSAGWTVTASGDGVSTYNASGDLIGPTTLDTSTAWFKIRDPGGSREMTIHRAGSGYRIKRHPSGINGGTPSATQPPSEADEDLLAGDGTDAAPTSTALFTGDFFQMLNSDWEFIAIADQDPPYGFWAMSLDTGNHRSVFICDPVAQPPTSTDEDPYVLTIGKQNGTANQSVLEVECMTLFRRATFSGAIRGNQGRPLGRDQRGLYFPEKFCLLVPAYAGENGVSVKNYNRSFARRVTGGHANGFALVSTRMPVHPAWYASFTNDTAGAGGTEYNSNQIKGTSTLLMWRGSDVEDGVTVQQSEDIVTQFDNSLLLFRDICFAWDGTLRLGSGGLGTGARPAFEFSFQQPEP